MKSTSSSPSLITTLLTLLLLLFLLLLPQSSALSSQTAPFTGKVIHVIDGDSLIVITQQNKKVEVRLSGVDSPEGGQAHGKKAKQFTASMVYNKIVTIQPETIDRYRRTVGMVLINGSNLSQLIIANGYGWVYRQYCTWGFCDDWLRLEQKVRERRMGLWADKNPEAPWEWRAEKRNGGGGGSGAVNKSAAIVNRGGSGSGIYHGNVNSHVFHGSGCQHYNCKNCTVNFGSVSEAVGAGYRKHEQCVK